MASPRNHYAIVQSIEELLWSQRMTAMRGLVEAPDVPKELVLMLVATTGELPSRDREEFLVTVLDGTHGGDVEVRRAVRIAAEDDLPSRSRKRIAERLER